MFYFGSHGRPVHIFNKRPRNYSMGGMIHGDRRIVEKDEDTISSLLEEGSLVVPVPVMRSGIMAKFKGPLSGPKCNDMSRLIPTIVMPGEIVVHRDHAPAVTKFLKKNGITLPLPE